MRLEPGPGYSGWCWRRSCVPRCRGRAGLRPPGGAAGHHRLGRRARWLPGQLLDTLAQGDTTAVIVEGAVALHEVRSGRQP
jgi:hypothetical protein